MKRPPKTVVVIAAFLFAATAIAVVVGCALLQSGKLLVWLSRLNPQGVAAFQKLGKLSGVLLLVLAAGTGSAAVGLLHRKRWAWWYSVALFAANGLGDFIGFFATHDVLRSGSGMAVSLLFLVALFRHPLRIYFQADS